MPQLDPTQPAIVIKEIVTPGGNVYAVRATPYKQGEIPEEFFTDEYVTQKGVQFVPVPAVEVAATPVSEERVVLTQGTIVESTVNINMDSPDKVAAFLQGVGPKTVEKLDTLRQEKPFESIEDLNERCPLPKVSGKTWESFKDQITF